jgi:hypothetical protein
LERLGDHHQVACLRHATIESEQVIEAAPARNEVLEKLMRAFVEKSAVTTIEN